MDESLTNKTAVKALARSGRLLINTNISMKRAKILVALGWARMHPNKKLLGISNAGRVAAGLEPIPAPEQKVPPGLVDRVKTGELRQADAARIAGVSRQRIHQLVS